MLDIESSSLLDLIRSECLADNPGLDEQLREIEDECEVGRCKGVVRRAHDDGNTVDVCLWYDDLTGLMYSVSVVGADSEGFDITAAAQILYIPMQTE
mgnify:CR=1 FL=1